MPIFFSPLIAFAITFASILLLKPLAIRVGLIDEPGGRKQHQGQVPLIGGIAMAFGLVFSVLTLPFSLQHYRCLLAAVALVVVTGLLDDFHELTPRSRLFIQIFVGILIATWGQIKLQTFGYLWHGIEIKLGYASLPITVLAVVALINAVNMTDGADGLAGSIAFIEFFFLAWLTHHAQLVAAEQLIYLILSILLAFLCFNFPWRQKASVFMGDSGSMLLGLLLVWFCIDLSQGPSAAAMPVTFLWIAAVPLFDIGSVVLRRLFQGFSPFKADRGHLHHYLLQCGFSNLKVTLSISLFAMICGMIGIIGQYYHLAENISFFSFILLFIIYVVLTHWAWKKHP